MVKKRNYKIEGKVEDSDPYVKAEKFGQQT